MKIQLLFFFWKCVDFRKEKLFFVVLKVKFFQKTSSNLINSLFWKFGDLFWLAAHLNWVNQSEASPHCLKLFTNSTYELANFFENKSPLKIYIIYLSQLTDIQIKQDNISPNTTKSQNKFKAFIKRRSEPILKIHRIEHQTSDVPKIKLNS